MAISERQLLDALSRTPFVDSTELALILGEPHATVHRALADLLAEGIVGRVSHGTAHLPSSQRYHNPGDVSPVREGVSEIRIDYGPGYRVYFTQRGEALVVLLAGGDKDSQERDIRRALELARGL